VNPGRPAVRYFVSIQGSEHVVDITETDGQLEVVLDDRPVRADLTVLAGTSLHSLLLDGHSREMVLVREGDKTFVSLDGERIEVRVQDEVTRALSAFAGPATSGPAEIVAPMPGVVVAIPVKPGDEVTAGQAVIVVEAMKMQNELTADADGIVDRIEVAVGNTVDGGAVLVVLKPKEEK
jgi:biotin carboxyl carrier protein